MVTANKALLAERLRALTERAASRRVDLFYEAAVAGAIPIVRVLRTSLAGQRLERVLGIVNGTTNFLLTTMTRDARELDDVLEEATARGFAERDPSADLDGHDAAQKAAILATLAFGTEVTDRDVPRVGIAKVTLADLEAAARMGHVVRLLAVAERVGEAAVSVRVHPAMVPASHPLAAVDGASNAIFVEGEGLGPLMLEGRGAGGPADGLGRPRRPRGRRAQPRARRRRPRTRDRRGVRVSSPRVTSAARSTSRSRWRTDLASSPRSPASSARTGSPSARWSSSASVTTRASSSSRTRRPPSDLDATVAELERLDAVTEIGAVLHVVEGDAP